MTDRLPELNLANYLLLLTRVDQLCGRITAAFAAEIACKAGCSGCCRHLALFPVEAANVVKAVGGLSAEVKSLLAERSDWPESSPCPLLFDDYCLVYSARPIICRTHGLPLLAEVDGAGAVDCCPENFKNSASLPGSAVINLETLNSALVAINALFIAQNDDERFQGRDRLTIAAIIRLTEGVKA